MQMVFAPKPEKLKVNIEKSPFDRGFSEVSPKFVFQLVYSPMVFNYFLLQIYYFFFCNPLKPSSHWAIGFNQIGQQAVNR